jgi:hypothetical protein
MSLKFMDPEEIQALIADEPDVLTPLAKEEAERFDNLACPACGSRGATRMVEEPRVVEGPNGSTLVLPFDDKPLAKCYAVCRACSTEFDPQTGLIRRADAPFMTHE